MKAKTQTLLFAVSFLGSSYAVAQKTGSDTSGSETKPAEKIEYTEQDKRNAEALTSYNERENKVTLKRDQFSKYTANDIRRATRYTAETSKLTSVPTDWPGCECKSPVVLAEYDFDNISGTVAQAPASSNAPGIVANPISGPGNVTANPVSGSNFGCFGGFSSSGTSGVIGFNLTNESSQDYCLSDITFDYFAEGASEGLHGPDQFIVQIGDGTDVFWQTETITAGIGSANVSSFSMNGQQGSQLVSGSDWLEFVNGETFVIDIIASGANNSNLGFDMDNVQVLACPVPEPSSTLLVLLGSGFLLGRRKR